MTPGERMAADIADQPAVVSRLLTQGAGHIAEVAARIAQRCPRFVVFAARGTSDHAALYAKYLAEIRLGLPSGLASPSTFTVFGRQPDYRDVLLVTVSQSGASPDLVKFTEMARSSGATTVAVTNTPDSPLSQVSEMAIDVDAGAENAVAATKTYVAELVSLFLLMEGIGSGGTVPRQLVPDLDAIPEYLSILVADPAPAALSSRYRFASRLLVTGRGYAYPTAREAALKLMETSYVAAQAFSGADLLHGPVAMADPGLPVIAIVDEGSGGTAMIPVVEEVVRRGADLLLVGSASGALRDVPRLATPAVDERLAPILDIVPLQLLGLHVALNRGEDPDAPRGLRKVTETF